MTLTLSGENLDLGEALRQPVLEKAEAAVAGAFGDSVNGHVAMTREASSRHWLGRNRRKIERASAATGMAWREGRAGENRPGASDPAVMAENSPIVELVLTGAPVAMFQHAGSARKRRLPAAQSWIGWLDPQASRELPDAP